MSDFTNTIDQLGDDVVSKSLIDRTITEFKDNVITTVGEYAFTYCNQLRTVDLPNVTSIGSGAFNYCSNLKAVVLRKDSLCTLAGKMDSSAIANKTGYIYVPRVLLSDDDSTKDYRRATNWSTYSTQFRALEDYTVDGTITGELDSTKI